MPECVRAPGIFFLKWTPKRSGAHVLSYSRAGMGSLCPSHGRSGKQRPAGPPMARAASTHPNRGSPSTESRSKGECRTNHTLSFYSAVGGTKHVFILMPDIWGPAHPGEPSLWQPAPHVSASPQSQRTLNPHPSGSHTGHRPLPEPPRDRCQIRGSPEPTTLSHWFLPTIKALPTFPPHSASCPTPVLPCPASRTGCALSPGELEQTIFSMEIVSPLTTPGY